MKQKFSIVAALGFALVLCFALVGCGGVDKSLYTGDWTLESGTDKNLDADSIALMKTLGMEVRLTLNDDETGKLVLFGDSRDITWKATSNTEGEVSIDGASATLKLEDEKLTISDANGTSMTFAKADGPAPAASAPSSSSASASAASADAQDAEAASEGAASDEAASGDAAQADAVEAGDDTPVAEGEGEQAAEGEASQSAA